MHYMLLFCSPAKDLERSQDDPESKDYFEAWRAYMSAIYAAGIVSSGNALEGAHAATTVKLREGKRHVLDGPYADTKDVLGGYLVIDVPSIDEALAWAARSPSSSSGSTEVRPIRTIKLGG